MKNWSLNTKFIFVLSIFIVACIAVSALGLNKMNAINVSLENIAGPVSKRLLLSLEMQEALTDISLQEKNFILEPTTEGMKKYEQTIKDLDAEVRKQADELYELARPEVKPTVATFKTDVEKFFVVSGQVQALSLSGKNDEAFTMSRGAAREARLKAEESLDALVAGNTKILVDETAAADVLYADARNLMLGFSTGAILLGCVLAFFILKALSKSIDQVISNLDENSTQVTSAAQQIAAASEQLSQATTEQAASLEETAASIEEMSSMVQRNSDNAAKSSEVSLGSQTSATRGKQVVREMIDAIGAIDASNNDIMNQINESNNQIADIVKVISEIGEKTKVINDIVFQTKLLSFNASVEAARAGEHGKGFAVVAEEVGNLAQMSGNAAKEISGMLEGSIQKVEGIVKDTQSKVEKLVTQGKEKVQAGTSVAQQCGEVLEEIVGNVTNVSSMVSDISNACLEQSQGVQEITKAMAQLDQVTQENAATSEEAASSAEELSAQADSLKGVVQVLIATIKGGNSEASRSHATTEARSPRAVKAQPAGKLVHLKTPSAKPAPAGATHAPEFKKVAGQSSSSVPLQNDPRFDDV